MRVYIYTYVHSHIHEYATVNIIQMYIITIIIISEFSRHIEWLETAW
jgi:hypothetical protein